MVRKFLFALHVGEIGLLCRSLTSYGTEPKVMLVNGGSKHSCQVHELN